MSEAVPSWIFNIPLKTGLAVGLPGDFVLPTETIPLPWCVLRPPKHTEFVFFQLKFFSRDAAAVVGYSGPEPGRRAGVYSGKIRSLRAFLLISSSASEGIYATPCFVCRQRNGVGSAHVKLRLREKWNLDYF